MLKLYFLVSLLSLNTYSTCILLYVRANEAHKHKQTETYKRPIDAFQIINSNMKQTY